MVFPSNVGVDLVIVIIVNPDVPLLLVEIQYAVLRHP
jgi:hypothetical protein